MTAVATFISKAGVAIAADSASTIAAGVEIRKVYNSANKLFHLSEKIPVAAVIWGDAGYKGVPWSILMREFGESIKKPYRHFYDYPELFLKFLKKNKRFFRGGHKSESFQDELRTMYHELKDKFLEECKAPKSDKSKLLDEVITCADDYYDKTIPYTYSELHETLKKVPFRNATKRCINEVFSGIKLSDDNYFSLVHIAELCYVDTELNDSGIFMAGYGSKDLFPSQAIISDGVFDRKFSIVEYLTIDNEKSVGILRLLAQYGPANTFLEGIDDRIRHFVSKQMEDMVNELVSLGSSRLDAKSRRKFTKAAEKSLSEKESNIESFISERYKEQIQTNLEFMPLDDMAQLVEMMVKLTAYRSRLSDSHETVGGPIDVAIINRDKVFSWARKKSFNALERK